jgi:hypothetical protein
MYLSEPLCWLFVPYTDPDPGGPNHTNPTAGSATLHTSFKTFVTVDSGFVFIKVGIRPDSTNTSVLDQTRYGSKAPLFSLFLLICPFRYEHLCGELLKSSPDGAECGRSRSGSVRRRC